MKNGLHEYLGILAEGNTLTQLQAETAMQMMLSGEVEPVHAAGFLMGLRARGENTEELIGFTRVMRRFATPVEADPDAIDLCGTGGDGTGTFNISTAAAFVCAGAGAVVAKHGNRSVSSKAGSADVLEALGVQVELGKDGVEYCLDKVGIAFLFAPFFHPAMRYVMPVRRGLGVRTFFNILGPLSNPAGVKRQLIGSFNEGTARKMAEILGALDAEHIITAHASDGLDEISLAASTKLFEFQRGGAQGQVIETEVVPEDRGISRASLEALYGGTAEDNARILMSIFDGETGPRRDIVVLNAAYGLYTTGRYASIEDALAAAQESIDSGGARQKVQQLVEASNKAPRII